MSSALDVPPLSPGPRSRRAIRWSVLIGLSLLLHLAFLDALPDWTIEPDADQPIGEPLRATLMPLVPPAATPITEPVPPQALKPQPRLRPRPAPVAKAVAPEAIEAVPRAAVDQGDRIASPAPQPPATATPPATPAVAASEAQPVPASGPPPTTAPPRSARLDYQVISSDVRQTNPIYGKGTITWAIADGRYVSDLKAAADVFLFKIDVLSSHSEGSVGPGGLAPDRYLESPRHKATVATNFNRDARQSITFSASSVSAPLMPGAQDRLSVLFQIGALLLGDPQKLVAGTNIDIPVAGVRGDVESWRFAIRGNEALETGVGSLSTVHLQRAPRPGSNDRTIDVWVAEDDGGYPARVLYTEPNGNTVMMTLDRISAMP